MNFFDLVKESIDSIFHNKLRSGLTILGIVIGIAAVIIMVSLGQGAQKQIVQSIQNLGSNLISIFPGVIQPGRGFVATGRGTSQTLKLEDINVLKDIETIEYISPELNRRGQVVSESGNNINTLIIGAYPEYFIVRNFEIEEGMFFTENQMRSLTRVAILGNQVKQDLFGDENPIGKKIRINNVSFKVIGVLKPKGSTGFINPDDSIVIPLLPMQKFISGNEYLSNISLKIKDKNLIDQTIDEATIKLAQKHRVPIEEPDFSIISPQEILSTFNQIIRTLTLFLASIAGISLVVGGIGIMNMMLTTVNERVKEIGIRKAIGAKRGDINKQFLIESIVLTFIGGILGIILGVAFSLLISKLANLAVSISLFVIILASGISIAVGIIFGYWPAKRASELDPIEALRYE